jgi:hypothetical protein
MSMQMTPAPNWTPGLMPAGTTRALIAALVPVVALVADRARAAGEIAALQDALAVALEDRSPGGADPREAAAPRLPGITDATAGEAAALRDLAARQAAEPAHRSAATDPAYGQAAAWVRSAVAAAPRGTS